MKTGKARNALAAAVPTEKLEKPKKQSDSKKSKKGSASVQEEQEEDDLPPGWVRVASTTKPGAFYYAHPATNQTQTEHPGGKISRSDSATDQRSRDKGKAGSEDEEDKQRKIKEDRAKLLMKESEQRAEEKKRKRQEQKQAEEQEAEEAMRKAMEKRARERATRETQMKEMETEVGKTKKDKKEKKKKKRKSSSSSSEDEEVTEAELKKWREEEEARERELMEAERRKQQEEEAKRRSHDDEQKRKKEKLAAEVALKAAETARKAAEMEDMKRREKEEEQKRRIEAKRTEAELKRLNEEKKREEELEAFRKMTESAKDKKKEEEKKKELLTNDGNFMAKFLAMQKDQTTQKEFKVDGKWVMTDKKSGDKFKYNFTHLSKGSFAGEQRGAGKVTQGIIDGDQISWQVANIKCTGRLESSSKLVDGSYFNKDTGEKLGSFSGECQGASERPKDDDHSRSRGQEEGRQRRREEDDERRRKEDAERRRREEDQNRLHREEDERRRRREDDERRRRQEDDERRRRQQEVDEEQERRRRRQEEEEASRKRRREEDEIRRRREEASTPRRKDYDPDEGIRKDYDPDAKEHDAKRARLSELLEESANPAPFTKSMGPPPAFPPAFPPVPPKVMGKTAFPPPPPMYADPAFSANLASAPPAAPKPVATGMVMWYNGRQLRGVILADQDGKLLQIAPNGAPNVGAAPPIPEGLMHGTRVTYSTTLLPGIGSACTDVRPLEGQIGLSCGGDSQVGGREVNEDRTVALDLPDGFGHLVGVIDGHRGVHCSDFLTQRLPQAVVNSVRQSFGQFVMSGRSINSLTTAEEVDVIRTGLVKAFEASDRDFLQAAKAQNWGDGACAMTVLLAHGFQCNPGDAVTGTVPNARGGVAKCFVAWCGTTRMLLLRGRSHLTCTREHVCSEPEEMKRLQSLGALLVKDPNGRTFMGRHDQMEAARQLQQGLADTTGPKSFLASSRGFGDIQLKESPQSFFGEKKPPILTATPEVSVLDLTHEDWGIVLVGRGVCSVLSDQDIADICLQEMGTMRKGPIETAKVVTARAAKKGAKDNLTCIAMRLGWVQAPMQMSLAELLTAGKAAPPPPPPPTAPMAPRPVVPVPRLHWQPDAPARPPPPAPVIVPAKTSVAPPVSKGQGFGMLGKTGSQAFQPPQPKSTASTVHSGPISPPGLKGKGKGKGKWHSTTEDEWHSTTEDAATPAEESPDAGPPAEVTAEPIDPNKRYTGKLKFWNPKNKTGAVALDSSFALEEVPTRTLPIEELQVNSGGKRPPKLERGLVVEFNIAQAEGEAWCVDVTLAGGLPITQANLERRKLASEESFMGTVDSYNDWGFGYIKPDAPQDMPPMVRAAMQNELQEFTKKRKNTPQVLTLYFRKQDVGGTPDYIAKKATVSFQVYMDEKGAGACNITLQE